MSIQLTSQKGKRYLYCDKDLVAKGGFGEVYKGIDMQTDEVVAVKRVDNSKIERLGDEYVKCLGNEANLLLEMNYNDRCVRIIDCFKTTGSVYIIMEFCDGGTLDGIMKKRPHSRLPEKEALEIFAEVVEGLSAMHNRGTMHRDMKPDNVFIKNGRYKIGDFGFATSKECSNQICGTPQYMAPEIHNAFKEGAKQYTKQVDVWALGIMLHEMLFGQRPYDGNQIKIAEMVTNNEYKVPNTLELTEETKDLLKAMLQRDPNKRLTMKDIVMHPALCRVSKNSQLQNSLLLNSGEYLKDLDLSHEMEQSIKKEFDEKHWKRIACKLDYYRMGCGFMFKRLSDMREYIKENNRTLDDLHPLFFYLIKFSLCKLSELNELIDRGECPTKLLLTYDSDYWKSYNSKEEFAQLRNNVKEGIKIASNLLSTLKKSLLPGYLDRKGKSQDELNTLYDENLSISCSATLELRMNEAGSILQKVSNQHNEFSSDFMRFYADIELCKRVKQFLDNNKYIVLTDQYQKDRDSGKAAPKVDNYIVDIIEYVNKYNLK